MTRRVGAVLVALVLAIAAGCDGGDGEVATQTLPSTTSPETDGAALEDGVRQVLRDNDRLSGHVLWSNRVPAWATRSTRGPALATLRRSAADRRMRGIRIRTLRNRLDITSIELDPSYTKATAVVRSIQRVRPYSGDKPSGRAIMLNERATVELRRVGASGRFVVWSVRVLD
jgi:hypothetical protein